MAAGGGRPQDCPPTADKFGLQVEKRKPDVRDRIKIQINSKFSGVMGSEIQQLTEDEYLQLHSIIEAPEIQENDFSDLWQKLFPYLLQKIKLWGCNSVRAAKINELVKTSTAVSNDSLTLKNRESILSFVKKSSTNNTSVSHATNSSGLPLSRADFITFLLFSVDDLTARSLLEVMSKFVLAMPLIVRHPQTDDRVVIIPLLRDIPIRWEAKPGMIIENRLFRNPCRLIVAVRIGSNAQHPGKSSILNQLMRKEHVFSSRDEAGGKFGKPCTIDGTIEFIWLTEETVSDSFWSSYLSEYYSEGKNELIMLANLHGDATEYLDTIAFFRSFNASFVAFLMPSVSEEKVEKFFKIVPEGKNLNFIIVDHNDHDDSNPTMVSTSNLNSDVNLEKIRRSVNETIRTSHIQQDFAKISCQEFGTRLTMSPSMSTELSQKIVDFVKRKTCLGTRKILQLQKSGQYMERSQVYKIWSENVELQFLITRFSDLQNLPLFEFKKAISHLEVELSILSSLESQSARNQVILYRESQRKLFQSAAQDKNQLQMQLQRNAYCAMKEVDDINLGVEHFFRELIQIHQANLFTRIDTHIEKDIFKLPEYSANLLLHGFAIEILNGDSGLMPVQWLTATCDCINKIRPKLKVFVLSIIGLQSSGKSTLLNALFSCKFAVSVGRCSRGLFARLIFLDELMKTRHNFDAFLLIDTEGLGSPEKMNDKDAEKKDRLMATFAMAVSDLTIINIMGESMTEMTEILQIAILAMARLESTGMKSDILVVQHLQERNASRLDASKESFIRALQYAFELTKNTNSDMGTLDASSLAGLIHRVQEGSFLNQFSALKDGPTANASPSEAYHRDVVRLYERIFEISREHPIKKEFSFWSRIVEVYWGFVSKKKFALRFKSAVEMVEFIHLEQRLAHLKELIAIAFKEHFQILQRTVKIKKIKFSSRENCSVFVDEATKVIPFACSVRTMKPCDYCRRAIRMINEIKDMVKAGDLELNTNKLIDTCLVHYRSYVTKLVLGVYDALEIQEEFCEEFEKIVDSEIKSFLKQKSPGSFSKKETQETTQIIWKKLVDTVQEKSDIQPIHTRIEVEIAESYKTNSNFIDDYYRRDISLKIGSGGFVSKVMGIFVKQREIDTSPEQQFRNRLQQTVNDFIESAKVDRFEAEMVYKLRRQFDLVITQFQQEFEKKLGLEFKLAAHALGLKMFAQRMTMLEEKWVEKNSADAMLRRRESDFKLKITIRLQHGFNSASEGALVGNQLFEAIRAKGKCFVTEQLIQRVLDQNWTTATDKIRLLYFDELVQDVQNKANPCQRSLGHFANPKASIEEWYVNKVNTFDVKEANRSYVKYVEQQLKLTVNFILTTNSLEELLERVEKYINSTDGLTFRCTQTINIVFEHYREYILNQLKEMEPQIKGAAPEISRPSESLQVMNRLGCTASCPWCGALCWGARGHMENNVIQNSTRHYTCHQPSGLIGVNNRNTHELLAESCEKYPDLCMVHFGEYKETGLLWKTAKEKHFSDWNFTEYPKPEFQKMMRWFFYELHVQMAQKYGLLPAPRSKLESHECCNLNIGKIMSFVRSTVGPI